MGEGKSKVAVRATVGAVVMEKATGSNKGGREGDRQGREEKCQRGQQLEKMSTKFPLLQLPSRTVSSNSGRSQPISSVN